MTNEQIIQQAAVASGLFTQETVDTFAAEGVRLPLHTYQEWRRLGYQVKQGEKAVLVVNLWRFSKVAVDTEDSAREQEAEHATGERAYTAKAHLFLGSQVEKIQGKPKKDLAAYNAMLAAQRTASKSEKPAVAKSAAAGDEQQKNLQAADLKAKVAQAKAAAQKSPASKKATSRKNSDHQTKEQRAAELKAKVAQARAAAQAKAKVPAPAVIHEPLFIPEQLDFSAVAASILA